MPEQADRSIQEGYRQLIRLQVELASVLNTDQLLERSAKAAAELCQAEHALIYLADPANHNLQLKSATIPNASQHRQLTIPIENSLEGWVFNQRETLRIDDYRGDEPRHRKLTNPADLEIRSILCTALAAKDTPIGVVVLINRHGGNFSMIDQELLAAFAIQVAAYIVNTQLFLQSDLISELVHELRTPLVSLNMAIQLIQRTDLPDEKRGRIFSLINTEFTRLSEMTTSFLEYARLESGRTRFTSTSFPVQPMLAECVEVMQFQADARDVHISMHSSVNGLSLTGDRDKIKQVILNLLNNAIKYNHPGGTVMLSAQRTPTDFSITVRDSGQGIAPEYLPRLFTRFFRAPNKETQTIGTGLGLTICKQIVEAHHGKLEVASEVEKGSTFTVRLPVAHENGFIPVE